MAQVPATLNNFTANLPDCYLTPIAAVRATCGRCGQTADAAGTGDKSRRLAMLKLRKFCPKRERNWYFDASRT